MPDLSPFETLSRQGCVSRSGKRHLLALSRSIEARALVAGAAGELFVCLQRVEFHGGATLRLHRGLANQGVEVRVYGVDVREGLNRASSVHLHNISAQGVLAREWNVLLVTPEFGLGLSARQVLPRNGVAQNLADSEFDWVVSEDRDDVLYAARSLPTENFVLAAATRV